MKGRTLYEEVWQCRLPRTRTIEEELYTLQSLAPDMAEDLRCLFREAVADSLASMLGESGARALIRYVGKTNFESPPEVFVALDSIFGEGSEVLKSAIAEEYRASVHLLLEKVERNLAANSLPPIVSMSHPDDRQGISSSQGNQRPR